MFPLAQRDSFGRFSSPFRNIECLRQSKSNRWFGSSYTIQPLMNLIGNELSFRNGSKWKSRSSSKKAFANKESPASFVAGLSFLNVQSRLEESLDAEFIAHGFHLIAEMVGVKHPGPALWFTASNRSKSLVLFRQGNFHINFFQISFGHRPAPRTETKTVCIQKRPSLHQLFKSEDC